MPRTGVSGSIYIKRRPGKPFITRDTPLHDLPSWFMHWIAPKIVIGHHETDCWFWQGPICPRSSKPVIWVPVTEGARQTQRIMVDKWICGHYWNFDPSLSIHTIYIDRRCSFTNCINPAHLIPRTSVNDYE